MTTRRHDERTAEDDDQILSRPDYSRLQFGESPIGSVVRAISAQHDRVMDELEDPVETPGEAVHSARKAIKRARGLLRLVRDALGHDAYRSLNTEMRNAARALARMRDASIRLETFELNASYLADRTGPDILGRTRDCLGSELASAYADGAIPRDVVAQVGALIQAARRRLAASGLGIDDRSIDGAAEGFAYLAHGLRRTYRRSRNGMRAAALTGDVTEFHEWRKGVKYLSFQLEHLELIDPRSVGARIAALKQVDKGLGDAHDLWMLGDFLEAHPVCCPDRGQREILVGVTDQMRREFDALALRFGGPLHTEAPGTFATRMEGFWSGAEASD